MQLSLSAVVCCDDGPSVASGRLASVLECTPAHFYSAGPPELHSRGASITCAKLHLQAHLVHNSVCFRSLGRFAWLLGNLHLPSTGTERSHARLGYQRRACVHSALRRRCLDKPEAGCCTGVHRRLGLLARGQQAVALATVLCLNGAAVLRRSRNTIAVRAGFRKSISHARSRWVLAQPL